MTTTILNPSLPPPPTERTIAGLTIETFSYILLAIGGSAPILFVIILVIILRLRRSRRTKSQYFSNRPKMLHAHELSAVEERLSGKTETKLNGQISNGNVQSVHNPEVFFVRASPISPSPPPPLSQSVQRRPSIGPEERKALECFNKIYEGLDDSEPPTPVRSNMITLAEVHEQPKHRTIINVTESGAYDNIAYTS